MKKKLSVLVSLAITGVLALTGCASKVNAEGTTNEGKFVVGLEAGYAPFNWTQADDSNGAVKIDGNSEYAGGYDVEIAKRVAEGLGKELVIVKTAWDGLVPALQSGKIDGIIAGMSPTADRRKQIDFSDTYYTSELVLVVKNGGAYENASTLADFDGAKITGQLSTFHYSVLGQIEGAKVQTAMDDFGAMRVALESGVIDAYISERPEGISAQNANSNFKMIEIENAFETSPEDTETSVGLRKGSQLTEEINEILAGISDEERVEIMDNSILNQPSAQ